MFSSVSLSGRKKIEFFSNPYKPLVPVVEPVIIDGKQRSKVRMVPGTNHSPLEAFHFSREIHSLRAKLNLGIPLSQVPNVNKDDFQSAFNKATKLESDISSRLATLQSQEISSTVDSDNVSSE